MSIEHQGKVQLASDTVVRAHDSSYFRAYNPVYFLADSSKSIKHEH